MGMSKSALRRSWRSQSPRKLADVLSTLGVRLAGMQHHSVCAGPLTPNRSSCALLLAGDGEAK